MRTIRAPHRAFLAVLACMAIAGASFGADVIDRVLAIVGGFAITQSDVAAAIEFDLVPKAPAGSDRIRLALDELIRRRLIIGEANRFAATDTLSAAIDRRVAEIRAKYGSDAAFQAALARTAMTVDRLKEAAGAALRMDEYVEQRFGAVAEPSDLDVATYYAANQSSFTSGGRVLTFDEAKDLARQRLARDRRETLIREWVQRLRRRTAVTDLYAPDAGKRTGASAPATPTSAGS